MSNSTLNHLLKDYEQKKYQADLNFEKDKEAFYRLHPELIRINDKLSEIGLSISKAVLTHNTVLETKLKSQYRKLKQEKEQLLASIQIPARSSCPFI